MLAAIKARTELPIDAHLMVEDPDRLLDAYLDAGADWVSVHWEAATHLDRTLGHIRDRGALAGVVLNPSTPVEVLVDCLHTVDYVLLMSVNPGFAGQAFLPRALDKARRLRTMIDERGLDVAIEMDGGIGPNTIRDVVAAGVDICVAGSAVFGRDDPAAAMAELERLAAGEET